MLSVEQHIISNMGNEGKKFVCINCGVRVQTLCKKYVTSVLKLNTCDCCGNVVDRYIEYDSVIMVIDLILLNREAYRHILFNREFTVHWKLTVMLLIVEAYSEFILNANLQTRDTSGDNTDDLLFYKLLLKVALQMVVYISTIFMLTTFYNRILNDVANHSFVFIWKSIAISSFGLFLLLPSLMWNNNAFWDFHVIFVYLYTTLSHLLAYTLVCDCPKLWSMVVVVASYFIKLQSEKVIMPLLA